MDELIERVARLSPERREILRRLAPEQYAALVASETADTEVEGRLKEIWSEVLGIPVDREDNYFELGGDSILSVSIVAKARAAGLRITPRMLFGHPTVASLAEALTRPTEEDAAAPAPAEADLQAAPLTPLQQGMVFHSLHDAGRAAYVSQLLCTLSTTLDRDRVAQAWTQLMRRHVVLQAAVDLDDPLEPRQRLYPDAMPVIEYRTLEGATPQQTQQSLDAFLQADLEREFDLAVPPLLRLTFLETAHGEFSCVWTHHHLLLDGWSQLILLQEFQALYLGASLPPVTTSFLDYAMWVARRDDDTAAPFWNGYLKGAVPAPLPRGGSPASAQAQARIVVRLAASDVALSASAQRFRVSPAVILEAAWVLALGRMANAGDVTFGMTATVRPADLADSERIVGLCINTLPMRIAIPGEGTVPAWLASIQSAQRDWLHHAHAALPDVLRWGQATKEVFDTLLVFENLPKLTRGDAATVVLGIEDIRSTVREHYPMVLVVTPGEDFVAELKYMPSAIAAEQAELAMALFECAIRALLDAPDMPAVAARLEAAAHDRVRASREHRAADDRQRLLKARRAPISTDIGAAS